jgi:hypothetical protein
MNKIIVENILRGKGMNNSYVLSKEDEQLLLEILLSQQYAFELISCEITDIENGFKQVDMMKFEQLKKLYDFFSAK